MNIGMIAAILPLIHWYRFRNVPIDRDFAPYAYSGVFGTGYLKAGHIAVISDFVVDCL